MKKILTPFLLSLALSAVLPMENAYAASTAGENIQSATQSKTPFQYSMKLQAVEKIVGKGSTFKNYGIKELDGSVRFLPPHESAPIFQDFLKQSGLEFASNDEIANHYDSFISFLVDFNGFVALATQSTITPLTPVPPIVEILQQPNPVPVIQQVVKKMSLGDIKLDVKYLNQLQESLLPYNSNATKSNFLTAFNSDPASVNWAHMKQFMANNRVDYDVHGGGMAALNQVGIRMVNNTAVTGFILLGGQDYMTFYNNPPLTLYHAATHFMGYGPEGEESRIFTELFGLSRNDFSQWLRGRGASNQADRVSNKGKAAVKNWFK